MPRPIPTDDTTRLAFAGAPFDTLFPAQFSGREAIGAVAELSVRAIGAAPPVALAGFTGKHATLSLVWGETPRLLDAVCTRAAQLPSTVDGSHYAFELRSWLWLLTLASNNRIFQGKTTQQIVEAVFSGHSATDFSFSLTGTYTAREYCVQYAETDFAFVSRLCEEEGWFYFFQHESGKHTLMVADHTDAFATLPGAATLAYTPGLTGERESGQILYCELVEQSVSGVFASSDYAYLTPTSQLFSQAEAVAADPKVYEYPGRYQTSGDAASITKRRIDELRSSARRLIGESDCRALLPGYKFTLSDHESTDANIEWVVASVVHDANHDKYRNRFEAFPAATAYRPPRTTPRPVMPTQTATVVGKAGEELWTDQYGRVKVKFHWDQSAARDETSSCWIRVAQPWAGQQWGGFFLPRIGQEVIVSFLDGNPDRPIITGSVYNGQQTTPYSLPDEQTKSTIKSNSSKGGSGFNELRFEDKQGAEEVFLQAQKDMKVNVLGDQAITVANKRDITVTSDETHTSSANFTHTVSSDYTLNISGNLKIQVSGAVSIQSGTTLDIEAGTALTSKSGTSLTNQAGTSMTNEAQISISSKANAQHSVESSGVLQLKGALVQIN